MSYYLVELYTPNANWNAQTPQARAAWLAQIQAAMGGLAAAGIELLALNATDTCIAQASPHQYLGIWRFENPAAREALLAGIQASGWYDFFEHVNAACDGGHLEQHLQALQAA